MAIQEPIEKTTARVPHPRCPSCDVAMWMVRVDPSAPRGRQHWYECKACGLMLIEPGADPRFNNSLQSRPLNNALASLCDRVEALAPGSIAGLTICNPSRTHIERAIFPRVPQYAAAITAIPLSPPNFGSCVRAVALGEIITCPDIAEERRFDPQWQRLGLDHGIRSLQSRPVYLRDGRPYGTFVLAYRRPRMETDWDVALMKFAADAAGLIIQSDLDPPTSLPNSEAASVARN